jgi:glyoxylase-like metal-dependent hydrolase (beta-lactamase superfamily II)
VNLSPRSLDTPVPGELVEILPGVARITAPNPSLMTGPGTNTYLVGDRDLVALDPGPADDAHLDAVAAAAEGYGRIAAVVVTHHHSDHAPGARGLKARTGAVVLGYAESATYTPDRRLREGDVVELGDLPLTALHTPGHAADHLCYRIDRTGPLLFSGDHIMAGSTVVIAPPDGDMAAYLDSLKRLLGEQPPFEAIAPGHGSALCDPIGVIAGYLEHRLAREAAVAGFLERRRRASIEELVAEVYTDVPEVLHPVARYSVWAHLLKLRDEGRAESPDASTIEGSWTPAPGGSAAGTAGAGGTTGAGGAGGG